MLAFRARSRLNEPVLAAISVWTKPGSKKGPLVETGDDEELTIYVREPAVDGKANESVIRVLTEHLGVPGSQITLTPGVKSRVKRFWVA